MSNSLVLSTCLLNPLQKKYKSVMKISVVRTGYVGLELNILLLVEKQNK